MTLSELELGYVKQYLRVDHNKDDIRIQNHLDSEYVLISFILKSNGQTKITKEFEQGNDFLVDAALAMVEELYDNGKLPESTYFYQGMMIDRRF